MLSFERLQKLLEKEENLSLLKLALERESESQKYTSKEGFHEEFDINEVMIKFIPELEME